jgi:hypothetical protein
VFSRQAKGDIDAAIALQVEPNGVVEPVDASYAVKRRVQAVLALSIGMCPHEGPLVRRVQSNSTAAATSIIPSFGRTFALSRECLALEVMCVIMCAEVLRYSSSAVAHVA